MIYAITKLSSYYFIKQEKAPFLMAILYGTIY